MSDIKLTGIGDLVFSDRYALKDPTRNFQVGDKVVVLIEMLGEWPSRGVGYIEEVDVPRRRAKIRLKETEEVIERPFDALDKVLEPHPSFMWDRMARWLAEKAESEERKEFWQDEFRWLLDGFKFSPGGRINAYVGSEELRPYMSEGFDNLDLTAYNCLAGETPLHTINGVYPIKDLVGTRQTVLSMDGKWREAEIRSFGVQKLLEVELANGEVLYATPDHDWFVVSGDPGDVNKRFKKVKTTALQGLSIPMVTEGVAFNGEAVRVINVRDSGRTEEVYCGIEPETNSLVIGSGYLTGNCYVIGLHPDGHSLGQFSDSRQAILDTVKRMVEIMARGGGVGVNVSPLRPSDAYVRGVNGRSSGAVSWMGMFSYGTGLVSQGGSRRGML